MCTATIYHGNCVNLLHSLEDNSIDFVLTDPPYFLDTLDDSWSVKTIQKRTKKSSVIGGLPAGMRFDKNQGHRLEAFFFTIAQDLVRVLKPGGFMIAFSQGRLIHRLAIAAEDAGFEIRDMFIWQHKGGQGKAFSQAHFVHKMPLPPREKKSLLKSIADKKTAQLRPMFEPMILAQKTKEGTFVQNWEKYKTGLVTLNTTPDAKQPTTIFHYDKPKLGKILGHTTVKPLALFQQLIAIFSMEGQTVLDPFLGSGTSAEAALSLKRNIIGAEIEESYYNTICNRIAPYL